ncbi:MAG TPA: trypsin-like peptidase domain-containing protein [Candidatus Limnocylindria bacterium]|nr:trypsin-like peptidase domain-containing protein [Candidatus Limnocylindria bacterium]HEX2883070.1 trypsin-like peptidase domain-containing protein [Candidatus Limnocylindria bacterium]
MTDDPNRYRGSDPTQPVEVQRYGPPNHNEPARPTWNAAPAWSSRPAAPPPAEPAVRRGLGAVPIIAIAIVAGVLSGGLSAVGVTNLLREPASSAAPLASDQGTGTDKVSDVRIDESSAVITAVDKVAPAVVTIRTQSGGVFGGASGTGSGVIYDANGWILTNRHVVEDAQALSIELNDGRVFDGTTYGIDTYTDLAIVKIDGSGLPTAPIGTSDGLEPGQLAIAIGNPLGYENTVTTGIVSGLGRQIQASDAAQTSAETLRNLIQTDAAINPGNSGGPLVNSAGQVIGINTAVSTSAQGLGFAIPIDVAKPIMQQALDGKELARPWIGVYYVAITPTLAQEQSLPAEYGALLETQNGQDPIFPESPAAEAGLKAGDVIVAVDGEQITADRDLSTLILPHEPGDTVTLRVLRGNSAQEVQVTLGQLPADAG